MKHTIKFVASDKYYKPYNNSAQIYCWIKAKSTTPELSSVWWLNTLIRIGPKKLFFVITLIAELDNKYSYIENCLSDLLDDKFVKYSKNR